ncbi:MAG: DUF2934 domain-containing protein [Candidatus Omnitrophica bacterium]|nr:DUF2934 domain-containing protein [Candidatus Omnitrophota bacterium]
MSFAVKKKAVVKPVTDKAPKPKKFTSGAKDMKSVIGHDKFNEYVSKRAYYIWQESGRPQGADTEIWLKAEKELRKQFPCK